MAILAIGEGVWSVQLIHEQRYGIVVVGGGLAGICAAIAAARCGVTVALVHDRPLLGGNASGELRIHTAGADCSGGATARYVRETGIIDEIRIENLKRNYADSHDILSLICREFVEREPNIQLYLNTRARRVRMKPGDAIAALEADQSTTEKEFLFIADNFIDCTGDGYIAAQAGASFRMGREAASEFGESLAPETADNKTLPSCVEFYLKDVGRPSPFAPPDWARHFESPEDLPYRNIDRSSWEFGNLCGGFWWLSTGGERDSIRDNEEIYDDLLAVVMGLWDLMKNRGDSGAENFALDWISPIPGKRESRRITGDYILNQNDVQEGRVFDDAVAYGGWPIDLHPPEGIFSNEPPNRSIRLTRPYTIPLRCLYSNNISNLWMAGRDISVSHVALGSTRVMATCAVIGQAAGVAAAAARKNGLTNRLTAQTKVGDIQATLRNQGAYIPFAPETAEPDLSMFATVTASGESPLCPPVCGDDFADLNKHPFQVFPLSERRLDEARVLLCAEEDCQVTAGLRRVETIWDVNGAGKDALVSVAVPAGRSWVVLPFSLNDLEPGMYLLWLHCHNNVRWMADCSTPVGTVRGVLSSSGNTGTNPGQAHSTERGCHAFSVTPLSHPYSPCNITRTSSRPEEWPNIWVSQPVKDAPQWIELQWNTPVKMREISLTFDGSLDSNITWPPPLGMFGCEVLPSVTREYKIIVRTVSGTSRTIASVRDNYQPHVRHILPERKITSLRIVATATNGCPEVRLYGVQVL